ncbi:MAG: Gfo/Idh/MocA family oxidoreductase [Planctomycetes bacterium]|nr:Gfo/Idh/MocA family oxidoreductase [Planctomycetota bacterium]
MRVAVIGSSGHVNYLMQGLDAGCEAEVVAIAPGSDGESMDNVQKDCIKRNQSPERFDDWRRMLDACKADLVVIACHFGDHAARAAEVLGRGINIFCEKPVATTTDDLDMLYSAWKKSGAKLLPMMGIRYDPAMLAAWKAVQSGAVGTVRLMTTQKSYKLGRRSEFFKNRETYGGTIPWVGSHAIDWLLWFGGARPLSVYAAHSALDNHDHGEMEMTALCHFTFPGEVFGEANIDYLRPAKSPTHGDDRVRVAGTKGVVEVIGGKALLISDDVEGEQELPLANNPGIFADVIRNVKGEESLLSARDAFNVTEACLLARESADRHSIIDFPREKEF